MKPNLNQEIGQNGEEIASRYLRSLGYHILERNVRTPFGEIDLVAEHEHMIVFVEVKTRTSADFGWAEEAVNFRKQKRLSRLAAWYLARLKGECQARFDVLAIEMGAHSPELRLVQNAFEAV